MPIESQHEAILSHALTVLDGTAQWNARTWGEGYSERCIEVPWAASFFRGGETCLDIGFTFASPDYLGLLLELRRRRRVALEGVDIIPPERVRTRYPQQWWSEIAQVPVRLGDIRSVALPRANYDIVTCISTIEHVGFDKAAGKEEKTSFDRPTDPEKVSLERDPDIDRQVLDQVAAALKPGGLALFSVPMGTGGAILCRDSLGLYGAEWEYEAVSWNALLSHSAFRVKDVHYFKDVAQRGWIEVDGPHALKDVTARLARWARGCAVAALQRL